MRLPIFFSPYLFEAPEPSEALGAPPLLPMPSYGPVSETSSYLHLIVRARCRCGEAEIRCSIIELALTVDRIECQARTSLVRHCSAVVGTSDCVWHSEWNPGDFIGDNCSV
jgi:hypothetical protein